MNEQTTKLVQSMFMQLAKRFGLSTAKELNRQADFVYVCEELTPENAHIKDSTVVGKLVFPTGDEYPVKIQVLVKW